MVARLDRSLSPALYLKAQPDAGVSASRYGDRLGIVMISGDLIRLKNLVDDCMRSARTIRRETSRLSPEEIAVLAEYVKSNAPYLLGSLDLAAPVNENRS